MTDDLGPPLRKAIESITDATPALPTDPPQADTSLQKRPDRWVLAAAAAVLLAAGLSVAWIARPETTDIAATGTTDPGSMPDSPPVDDDDEQRSPSDAAAPELQPEVQAFIFPLNAAEIAIGEARFGTGATASVEVRIARCMAAEGFNQLGALIENEAASSPRSFSDWLFPDIDYLTNHRNLTPEQAGAVYDGAAPAMTLFNWVSVSESSPEFALEELAQALRSNESYRTAPEDAASLIEAMRTCEAAANGVLPAGFEKREELFQDWLAEVEAIENTPAMKPDLDDLLVCLEDIDPRLADTGTAFDWHLARIALATELLDDPNVPTEQAIGTAWEWDEQYAACLSPVESQRTALRSDARDQLIQERLPQLLDLQQTLLAKDDTASNE